MITLLLRQNDVTTSFWRNNDVNIASCVRWVINTVDVSDGARSSASVLHATWYILVPVITDHTQSEYIFVEVPSGACFTNSDQLNHTLIYGMDK